MRVFLAGATGFVGGEILEELLRRNHRVTALARRPERESTKEHVAWVRGDLAEAGAWQEALEGHEAVVNAVGILRPRGRDTFQRVVVEGTRNLVQAAVQHRVKRFVLISANGIDAGKVPYQTTKLEAERRVRESGLEWTIFRPSVVFGPRDDFTNRFDKLMRLGAIPYFGRGDYALAPVAGRDLAEAVVQSLDRQEAVGQTFSVCGPDAFTFRQLLKEIRQASGRKALVLYAPRWVGYSSALLLGWTRWFPADRDALRMLFEGNVCRDQRWVKVFGIRPTPFREGIRAYLGLKGETSKKS